MDHQQRNYSRPGPNAIEDCTPTRHTLTQSTRSWRTPMKRRLNDLSATLSPNLTFGINQNRQFSEAAFATTKSEDEYPSLLRITNDIILDVDHRDEFLHGRSALVEGSFLFRCEFDLDDLLDSLGAEFHRNADKKPVDAVLSVEIGGARKNLFLVFEDGLDHFCGGGRWGVVRGPGLEMFDDLGAAVTGALDDALDRGLIHELSDGDASDGGIAWKRNHGVAVSTKDEGGYVLHADFEFLGNESTEAGGVEHASHADDALTRKAAHLVGGLRHGVERIGDDDEDAVRRVVHDLADHIVHDFVIGIQKVIAAHSGLARNSGGDDDDVGIGGVGVVVRANDVGIALLDRHGLEQVETLSLGNTLDDVDEDDVR